MRRSPQFQTHVLSDVVRPYTGVTPFVSRGNAPVLIVCLVLLGVGGYLTRRRSVYP